MFTMRSVFQPVKGWDGSPNYSNSKSNVERIGLVVPASDLPLFRKWCEEAQRARFGRRAYAVALCALRRAYEQSPGAGRVVPVSAAAARRSW
jgi:hypothetical protein